MERESSGEGHLLEEDEVEDDVVVVVEVEVEEEGEGDKYLEETCLPLGFFGTRPLFFSEGNNGGLEGWFCWEDDFVASEMAAATIIVGPRSKSPLSLLTLPRRERKRERETKRKGLFLLLLLLQLRNSKMASPR